MAPPGKYREWFPDLVRWMARSGLTSLEVARELKISKQTLYVWRAKYPDLADAMDDGRDLADARVEDSLFQRARGISWEEKTFESQWNSATEKFEMGCTKVVTKFTPPDTGAGCFWLKNRRPDQWRDINRFEHTGKEGEPIKHEHDFSHLSDAELEAEIVREAQAITGRAAAPSKSVEPPHADEQARGLS